MRFLAAVLEFTAWLLYWRDRPILSSRFSNSKKTPVRGVLCLLEVILLWQPRFTFINLGATTTNHGIGAAKKKEKTKSNVKYAWLLERSAKGKQKPILTLEQQRPHRLMNRFAREGCKAAQEVIKWLRDALIQFTTNQFIFTWIYFSIQQVLRTLGTIYPLHHVPSEWSIYICKFKLTQRPFPVPNISTKAS